MIVYPTFYLLDQFLNLIVGFNAVGIFITLLIVSYQKCVTKLPYKSALKQLNFGYSIYVGVGIISWSIWAAINAPSCGLTLKSLFSILLLSAIFIFWKILKLEVIVLDAKNSNFILWAVILTLCFQIFEIGLLSQYWMLNKPSGLFTEPSHLAMYLLPIIGYRLLVNYRDFLAIISIGIIMGFFNSATFVIGILLIVLMLICRKLVFHTNNLNAILILTIALIGITTLIAQNILSLNILTERLYAIYQVINRGDPSGITNASAIVWLNGWSQAYENLIITKGLGLGINQMGCGDFINVGMFSEHIQLWTGGTVLNSNDGSFLASKLISELGALGILIICYLVARSSTAILKYLIMVKGVSAPDQKFYVANAIGGLAILVLLFVRGNGYFLEPVILVLALLFYGRSIKINKII